MNDNLKANKRLLQTIDTMTMMVEVLLASSTFTKTQITFSYASVTNNAT
jgi:hypothetical protein